MTTAFLGLDYIIDICHPDGKIARSAAHVIERNVINKANQALFIAREKKWLTILAKVGFSADYQEQPKSSKMFGRAHEFGALQLGSRGTDFHPELITHPSDLVIVKPRINAFYCTALDAALRARHIDRLIIAGVSSTWAVQATVRDAHDRDYEILVVEDACADGNEESHQISMRMLATIAQIITVDELATL